MKQEQNTATLALVNTKNFAITSAGTDLSVILQDNLGGQSMDVTELDRIGIPAGGALQWAIPTLEGETREDEIKGVIVCWKTIRLYWAKGIEDGNVGMPPDCISQDSITGIGNPGGRCAECCFAQFGSAIKTGGKQGRGQACKMVRQLFVFREKDILPLVINLPPSSLKAIKKYFNRLTSAGKSHYSVITSLKLTTTKNSDGIKYAEVVPQILGVLDDESKEFFRQLKSTLTPYLSKVAVDGSEYEATSSIAEDNIPI